MKKFALFAALTINIMSMGCGIDPRYDDDEDYVLPPRMAGMIHDKELPFTNAERSAIDAFLATSLGISSNGIYPLVTIIADYLPETHISWVSLSKIAKNVPHREIYFNRQGDTYWYYSDDKKYRREWGSYTIERRLDHWIRIAALLPLITQQQSLQEQRSLTNNNNNSDACCTVL